MPPKKTREQQLRQVNAAAQGLTPEIIAKRNQRHLHELERSNHSEEAFLGDNDGEEGTSSASAARRGARQTISDKRSLKIPGNSPASGKRKSTMNVRTALLYRKNLATLIHESGIESMPAHVPTYLTAVTPPSPYPPRLLCPVCGYWGNYKCRRCGMPYCTMNCEGIHTETRCERRVI